MSEPGARREPDRDEQAAQRAATVRFGVTVAGVDVLLPSDQPVEYVEAAAVHPVPRMPPRVLGFAQLRGRPVPVLAPEPLFEPQLPSLRRMNIIVIGDGAMAGALPVASAPRALGPLEPGAAAGERPAAPLGTVLDDPLVERSAPDGARCYWHFDPVRLFETLARAQ